MIKHDEIMLDHLYRSKRNVRHTSLSSDSGKTISQKGWSSAAMPTSLSAAARSASSAVLTIQLCGTFVFFVRSVDIV